MAVDGRPTSIAAFSTEGSHFGSVMMTLASESRNWYAISTMHAISRDAYLTGITLLTAYCGRWIHASKYATCTKSPEKCKRKQDLLVNQRKARMGPRQNQDA